MSKSVFIKTFGCQMNEYDTELIRSILMKDGFVFTDSELDADVILLNTCSVREKANRTVFGLIHKIRHDRMGRPAIYGILGCMATNLKEELINDPHLNIDFIAGPDSYRRLPQMIEQCVETSRWDISNNETPQRGVSTIKSHDIILSDTETYEDIYPNRESAADPSASLRAGAWIAIMRGCNNFCSYCVVPYARGRERSRSPESIIAETKKLVSEGFAQATLLGQNVNSYTYNGCHFPELLSKIADVQGLKRVWFTSPHPKDVANELIAIIANHPKICKHIHLPLQAGSNEILKKMNRPYTREHYLRLVDKLRAACPEIAITTDIIVGFPTETDAQFQDTVDVFNQVGYDSAFIFKYSPRKQTTAARDFKNDVPENVKTERIVLLNDLQQKFALQRNQAFVGTTQEILIDAIRDHKIEGRTIHNKRVILKNDTSHKSQDTKQEILEKKYTPQRHDPRTPGTSEPLGHGGTGAMGNLISVSITSATPHLLKGEFLHT